jgi:twitching motility protein PilT
MLVWPQRSSTREIILTRLDPAFRLMGELGASDLHLAAGQRPIFRVDGELKWSDEPTLDDQELRQALYEITPEQRIRSFEDTWDADFGYENEFGRYRVNLFQHKQGCGAVFRLIPPKIMDADTLGLPPILKKAAMLPKGLVLVTGPTGSGKSTTLAAMVDHANQHRTDHIITIEDPIEFIHQSRGCLITHREVGTHTQSFAGALRAALREDPDIILVGEMRDLETIRLALEAALTGHLVLGTLHTVTASKTVERVLEVFPSGDQAMIRNSLAATLRVVVSQLLFKRADQPGRCAAFETLVCTSAVVNLIREGNTYQIPSALQTGKKFGMKSLEDSIWELVQKKWITPEEAYEKAFDKPRFAPLLKTPPEELT